MFELKWTRARPIVCSGAAYGHEVTIRVLNTECTSTVYFFADEAVRRNVLGRRGWLDRVRLGIVDYESTLYLSHHNEA